MLIDNERRANTRALPQLATDGRRHRPEVLS